MNELGSIGGASPNSDVIEALNHVLGNGFRLARTARICSWNLTEPIANSISSLFADQASEVWQAQDQIARRVTQLGGFAFPDESDAVLTMEPPGIGNAPFRAAHLTDFLASGHKEAIISLFACRDLAIEARDGQTERLLDERIGSHLRHCKALGAD